MRRLDMLPPPDRAIAVDWSGAATGGGRRSWLAEVSRGELIFLEGGWTADRLVSWLVGRAERDPSLVIGLDFAFSFPAWFVRARLGGSVEGTWSEAERNGESWLRGGLSPFWGRPGRPRPDFSHGRDEYRRTERKLDPALGRPKSVFQVGGAGSVGTGSIRGMPVLARLRAAGFAIWPFDAPALPLVVEIYPRALTGRVRKSDDGRRRAYLDSKGWPRDAEQRARAAGSEDAFDAAVSAWAMGRHLADFAALPALDEVDQLEGRIWVPGRGLEAVDVQTAVGLDAADNPTGPIE